MGEYYLYRHIRLDKDEPFYIGIGKKRENFNTYNQEFERAYSRSHRNKHWKNIVANTEYQVDIVYECNDWEEIKRKENEFIALYGRRDLGKGSLCNMTDGGEGTNGWIANDEIKKKISEGRMGIPSWNKGMKLSQEIRANMSKAQKGLKKISMPVEVRNKISQTTKGRLKSEEWKLNMSKTTMGRKPSQETVNKIRRTKIIKRIKTKGIRNTIFYKELIKQFQ